MHFGSMRSRVNYAKNLKASSKIKSGGFALGEDANGIDSMASEGALENYTEDCLLLEVVKPETSYTIKVLKTNPDYIGQQKWMKLLKDGKEITFNEVPEYHEKPINDLCQILYESRDKISEFKIKLK